MAEKPLEPARRKAQVDNLWTSDEVQFTRLLGEIAGVVDFTDEQKAELMSSMDLDWGEICEILNRADQAWGKLKEKHTKNLRRIDGP